MTRGIHMSMTHKYPHLFAPVTIGDTVFKNRIFGSPTGPSNLSSHYYPTPETVAYYERKARGGAASVCVGDASVDSVHGRTGSSRVKMDDEQSMKAMAKIAEAISRHGAVAAVELQHGGSHSYGSVDDGHQIYGPMECVDEQGNRILAMTEDMLAHTIRQYAEAAAAAKRAGFGMVTIHGGHGWLLSQFFSPVSNKRTDRWGGSLENRCRLGVAVCDAVREAVGPGYPIEIRISGSECHPGGYDIGEGVAIAKELDGHADIIHVSAGSHEVWDVFTVTHPSMFLEDGANVKYAAEVKKHVKKSYVAAVGALCEPALMEEIIASGKADIIQVARGLFADPDLPLKARTGREDEINRCMRCLQCFSNLMTKHQFLCAINPDIGHELENKWRLPPAKKKKILIAGGGIAGMQAALTASERGHEVILCEKSGRLGGALLCEDGVPFKKHLAEYIALQAGRISKTDISVRLNTEVTPELAESLNPDVVIAALGARPVRPAVKGIEGAHVFGAEEIYYHPEKAGKKAVILGGGLVGTELGIHLANLGREVTVVEMLPSLGDGGNMLQGVAVGVELRRLGINVLLNTKALEITSSGAAVEGPDGRKLVEADTVIYAVGQKPLRAEADALRFCAHEFHQLGDCLAPKNIAEATRTAHQAALDI